MHTLHGGRSLHVESLALEACHFSVVHYEGTDGCVRTNKGTLVTLDTIFGIPLGNESCHTTLLVSRGALLPCSVLQTLVCAYGQKVAVLCVDYTHQIVDECGIVIGRSLVGRQICPSGIYGQNLVLATTVYGSKVHVYHVLTLLAIRLDNGLLHLLYSQFYGDNLGDAEESRLEDGICAVAQTDFLSNLGCIDIINGDVLLGEVLLQIVGNEVHQFLTLENGIEQELTAGLQTTKHIVHAQIGLNVASHEIGGLNLIGRTDGGVTETQV